MYLPGSLAHHEGDIAGNQIKKYLITKTTR
jgi:hypothetical protein